MRKTAGIIMSAAATAIFLGGFIASPATLAAGKAPSSEVCGNKASPPTDAITQGGCLAIDQKKGNCLACHRIEGGSIPGNIAPPLISMAQRFPDKAKLRAQIWDSTVANPHTSMPPFGRHKILSEAEIDKIVEFMLTL
jgi:sulfur-oxidizing protein SoxX